MSQNKLYSVIHRSFFPIVFIFLQIFVACAALSMAEKYGDVALCPFDVKVDEDPSRIPKEIKQHTCRVTNKGLMHKLTDELGGNTAGDEKTLTCEDIGGHCVQIHETIKVSYRHRTMNHRKHDLRVNMSCVCVPLRGKPATPILPAITKR